MRLFFILGREPALGAAEILAIFDRQQIPISHFSISREALMMETQNLPALEVLRRELGGTIKIGSGLESWDLEPRTETILSFLVQVLTEAAPGKKRLVFGFSAYDASRNGLPPKKVQGFRKTLRRLGLEVKHRLQTSGLRARFVVSREATLSSVVVETNRLLIEGMEIVFLLRESGLDLGQTLAIQPWKEFSERDYGRPERDARRGLLPPKLAKMMINLARAPLAATLLDPFCGSGTILAEAWLLGYYSLIGSDLDSTAIARTKSNLTWLDPAAARKARLLDTGVKHLPQILGAASVETIVTEPYLGPPLRGRETPEEIQEIERQLRPLFHDLLTAFHLVLKSHGRAVIAFPFWKTKKISLHASVISRLADYHFALLPPLPLQAITPTLAPEFGADGKTLIYGRLDQYVWREIAILEKRPVASS